VITGFSLKAVYTKFKSANNINFEHIQCFKQKNFNFTFSYYKQNFCQNTISYLFVYFIQFSPFVSATYQNPVIVGENNPDPGAILNPLDNLYYAASTSNYAGRAENCFPIHQSFDLVHWKLAGYVFPIGKSPNWAINDYWAPEIHYLNKTFLVYFAARDKSGILCIGVARSEGGILGPYIDSGKPLVRDPGVGSIDATLFYNDINHKYYLYWKEDGNGLQPPKPTPIWAQELTDGGLALAGKKYFIISNDQKWEDNLVEGPWLKKRNNYYYLFYSANAYYDGRYGVGVARSLNPLGPYTKYSGPILHSNQKWIGPGHCSVITTHNGTDVMIYHSWQHPQVGGNYNRLLLIDSVEWKDDWPQIAGSTPSVDPQPIPH